MVRIVYDGPGFAGKTTNLQQVCELVSARKRTEMYTPAALKGRTMFFDWMEVEGPPISQTAVRFQLITVPGQIERNYRRRPLVEMADVVVFVADSTPEQIPDSMRTFARLRASMKRRLAPLPFIVQANKQDHPEAVSPSRLRRKLKFGKDVPIVPAAAVEGRGVRETLAKAMRIGLQSLSALDVTPPAPEAYANGDALFEHVLTFEDKPQEGPVDAEELYIGAEEVDVDDAALQVHLSARSLDALESKAKRAVTPGSEDEDPDYTPPAASAARPKRSRRPKGSRRAKASARKKTQPKKKAQ